MAMKKKRAAKKAKKRAVKKKVTKKDQPAFLKRRHFKKLSEVTRRQRISAAHRQRAAMPEESAPAAPESTIDLSTGFDPYEED